MTSIASLPQEIVDAVLDQLATLCQSAHVPHNEELLNENLRSCVQVSRSFRSHARSLLFSNVTLVVRAKESDPTSSRNLRALLEGDPDLAKLIHTFRLNLKGSSVIHSGTSQKVLDEHLPPILGLLPNLRKLILASLDGTTGWGGFNDKVLAAMFKFHDLPHLTSLELFGYNLSVPVDFVARWSTLTDLITRGSPFDLYVKDKKKISMPKYIMGRPLAQLTSLHLLTNFGGLAILLDEGNRAILRGLISLEADIYGHRDWAMLWKVMQCDCTMVQNLTIRNLYTTTLSDKVVGIAAMHALDIRNLRSLHMEEDFLQMGYDDVGHIADLLASHFASGPNLESIHVSLAWTWPFSTVARAIGTTDTWYQLDKRLAAATCFKRLDINIHYIYDESQVEGDALRFRSHIEERWTPENAFPILSKKSNSIVRLSLSDSKDI